MTFNNLVYQFTHWTARTQQPKLTQYLSHSDSALIGIGLGLTNFSLLPSILFIIMIQFNDLPNGGGQQCGRDSTALAVGMILSLLRHQLQRVLSSKLSIRLASLIGIFTYSCATAPYTDTQVHDLKQQNSRLSNEQFLYKLRAYKLLGYLSPPGWPAINEGRDKALQIRMGINTGYCTVDTFDTTHHLDYTALGTHANLASPTA